MFGLQLLGVGWLSAADYAPGLLGASAKKLFLQNLKFLKNN